MNYIRTNPSHHYPLSDAPAAVQIPMAVVGLGLLAFAWVWLARGGADKLPDRR